MPLDPADIEAIAQRVVELQRAAPAAPATTSDVLTRAEARIYVKKKSESAFFEWCQKWGVRPAIRGRYSRARLDVALDREARKSA